MVHETGPVAVQGERRLVPALVVLALAALPFLLPAEVFPTAARVGAPLAIGLLIAVVVTDPGRIDRRTGPVRGLSIALTLVSRRGAVPRSCDRRRTACRHHRGGAALGALAGHAAAGMSRKDLKELGEHLDAGQAGLVVVGVSDMGAKVEAAMAKADKVEQEQLEADTAEIQKDAEADG